jgi:asparagine synthase (glutamine-hydrolysing)
MFHELRKLPAAHYAIIEAGKVTLTRYWQPELYAGPYPRSDQEYLDEFAEQFERSVRMRLISEVPLGAYLSGGRRFRDDRRSHGEVSGAAGAYLHRGVRLSAR